MQYLRKSTSVTIMLGPFVDKADGVTLKTDSTTITDIDHATTGIFLSKAGGAAAVRHATVTASVADAYGMMKVTLDTTDTNTAGTLDVLFAKAATYLPVHKSFQVVEEAVFDALFATSAPGFLQPTVAGRTLDVSAGGEAGIDLANVGSPTTTLALTGTTIASTQKVDVETIKMQAVTAAAGVTFPTSIASPTNITAGTITTVTNLTNAPTAGDLTATMKASVTTAATAATPTAAAVTGAVGSVTGAVGSVVGLTASDVAAIKAKTDNLPTDPADESLLIAATNSILSLIGTGGAGLTALGDTRLANLDAAVSTRLASGSYSAPPSAATIAGQVWDVTLASHLTAGTTGASLNASGSAGDPWATTLPGAYGAGTAGKIVGDNLNATVSSRLATSGYAVPLDAAGLRAALGMASANLDTQIDALPTATENADGLLARDIGSGTGAGTAEERTVRSALRFIRNKWGIVGTTLTVTKEDDTTTAWSASVATDAAAIPVVGNNPT